MKTIQATVNPRLLTKASRLFTGTLQGRIIEILQNARRAGATKVEITNEGGFVTIRDNGRGIDDFARLLDLGGSGWKNALEQSEDPAGVGIFCLATRHVTIRSNGKRVLLTGQDWTGAPVAVAKDPEPVQGTVLKFADEPWDSAAVDINAVFTGLEVTVDGKTCPNLPFVSDEAMYYPQLGCRIEVRPSHELLPWHHSWKRDRRHYSLVLVNFHGQVVFLDYRPVSEHGLHYLVDMTGEPTGIRLMLPARTCLVENDALEQLKRAIEREAFRHIQKRGHHTLPFKEYERAKELHMELPEAKPTFSRGLLDGETPEPIEVVMPRNFPLSRCYRLDENFKDRDDTDEANAHLLAALGKCTDPFVPVRIAGGYDGYSWAKLPVIQGVEVTAGRKLHDCWMWSGKLVCVDSITVTAHASDGRVWRSPVCMAVRQIQDDKSRSWVEDEVLVTPEAERRLAPRDIWYHLGGWCDEGDTYDTQEALFTEELDEFWARLVGPDEQLRRSIYRAVEYMSYKWKSVHIAADGTVTIDLKDGSEKALQPPHADTESR